MKRLLILISLVCCCFFAQAAYLENVPQRCIQPNGDTLYCFASGDEFYHRLHDKDGFTIVQDPQTGYFVYATKEGGRIVPTPHIAGRVDPESVGLKAHVAISADEWRARKEKMLAPTHRNITHTPNKQGTTQNINNLVVFIRFAEDNDPFTYGFTRVSNIFNDTSTNTANSMYNFYKHISYNQLTITSHFFPAPSQDTILSYQDIYTRNYYEPYAETNPNGYTDYEARTTREMALLRRATEHIANMVPADLDIDYNNDGFVDNICFVVKGDVGGWSDLLWPHRWSLYGEPASINGLRVFDFNFILSENSSYFGNSTLSHEMFHTLGAPDLYHYYDDQGFIPVGPWDLMASPTSPLPQHPGAWMKYKYGQWIDEIPTITESGRYTVHSLGGESNENVAYIIPSEVPNEFFVVECRKKSDPFELFIPESGLVIYRINSDFHGNTNWNGYDELDEVYVYHVGGTLTEQGNIHTAAFKHSNQRDHFDHTTDPQPFLSNGYVSGIKIYDIHSYIDSISFSYLRPGDTLPSSGIEEGLIERLSLSPNPAHSTLSIELPDTFVGGGIEIFDMQGRLCYSAKIEGSSVRCAIASLKEGTYTLRATAPTKEKLTARFVKM